VKDNGCAILTISIPILIVIWLLLHPVWLLFFGVSTVTIVNSKQEFAVGDEIGWSIDSMDEELSPSLREYAKRSGGSVSFEGPIVGMNESHYHVHVVEEVSFRKLSGGGTSDVNYYAWVPKDWITPLSYRGEYSWWTWVKAMGLGAIAVYLVLLIYGALVGNRG